MPTEHLQRRAVWVIVVLVTVFETAHFITTTAPAPTSIQKFVVAPNCSQPLPPPQIVHTEAVGCEPRVAVDAVAADDTKWRELVELARRRGHPSFLLDSQFYNFGYPLSRLLCGPNCTAASPAPSMPHALLVNGGAPIVVDYPLGGLANRPSMGPYALAVLHCELLNQGYESFVQTFEPGYGTEYECPRYQVMGRPWDAFKNAVVVISNGQDANAEHTRLQLRPVKWMLGMVPLVSDVGFVNVIGAPFNHASKMDIRSSTVRILMTPTARSMYTAQAVYHQAIVPPVQRRNIVLVDNDAARVDVAGLQAMLRTEFPDAEVHIFQNIPRHEVPLVFQATKVTVDSALIGIEGINAEGAMFDCLTVVENARVSSNKLDFPIPDFARFNRYDVMGTLFPAVSRALRDYNQSIAAGLNAKLKQQWTDAPALFKHQVGTWFGSRSIVFRSYCRDFDECRAAIAWIFSVWNVHPLAYVELFLPTNLEDFVTLNDPVWYLTCTYLIAMRLALRYCASVGSARDEMFNTPPIDYIAETHRILVFCEPHMLVLGIDNVNAMLTAMHTLDPPAIIYGAAPMWVAVAAPYWSLLPQGRQHLMALSPVPTAPLDVLVYNHSAKKWSMHLTHQWTLDLIMSAPTPTYSASTFWIAELLSSLLRSPLYASVTHLFAAPYIQLHAWPPYARYCIDVGQFDY